MNEEDLDSREPRARRPELKNLGVMSIEALEQYIRDMEAEIARAREAIAAKKEARQGAESLFRK